jgi:hypothetical protein
MKMGVTRHLSGDYLLYAREVNRKYFVSYNL